MVFYFKSVFVIFLFLSLTFSLKAQDPFFVQFPFIYLFYNPAYAGFDGKHVCKTQMRNQWKNMFQTYSLSYDTHLSDSLHSGIGVLIYHNGAGAGDFTHSHFGGIYSYHFVFNQGHSFRIGTELSLNLIKINFSKLIFPDQLDAQKGIIGITNEKLGSGKKYYFDTKIGILYKFKNLLATFSIDHPTQPNHSVNSNSQSYLPRKLSGTLEYNFQLSDKFIFTPAFIYHKQDIFSYHDLLFNLKILKHYQVGFMYIPDNFFVWMLGVDFLKHWFVYFSREIITSELKIANPNSYEGGVRFRLSE